MYQCQICKHLPDEERGHYNAIPMKLSGVYHAILCPEHLNEYDARVKESEVIADYLQVQIEIGSKMRNAPINAPYAKKLVKQILEAEGLVREYAHAWVHDQIADAEFLRKKASVDARSARNKEESNQ